MMQTPFKEHQGVALIIKKSTFESYQMKYQAAHTNYILCTKLKIRKSRKHITIVGFYNIPDKKKECKNTL